MNGAKIGNMAQGAPEVVPIQERELQMHLNVLPSLEPGYNLSIFITEVDNFFNHLGNRLTTDLLYIIALSDQKPVQIGSPIDHIYYQNTVTNDQKIYWSPQ